MTDFIEVPDFKDPNLDANTQSPEPQPAHLKKPRKKLLHVLFAVAVCLCILFVILALLPRPARRYISTETIDWCKKQTAELSDSSNASVTEYSAPYYQFLQISIEAKVIEVLPDIYTTAGAIATSDRYRILRLRVRDAILGENMPDEIYYLLPNFLSTDLKEYDSLVMTVRQQGCENFVMINETQGRAEAFSFLFSSGSYDPDQGAVLAFNNGELDMSLWEKEGWDHDKRDGIDAPMYLLSDKCPQYPGKIGRNLKQTKHAILEQWEVESPRGVITNPDSVHALRTYDSLDWAEARQTLNYVQPFRNGVFVQVAHNGTHNSYEYARYINGFRTNEWYGIHSNDQSVHSSDVHFTDDDLHQLPNPHRAIEALSQTTTRIDPETGNQLVFCGIQGFYEKSKSGIICTLNVYWGDPTIEKSRLPSCYVVSSIKEKDLYVVLPDGSWSEIVQEKSQ